MRTITHEQESFYDLQLDDRIVVGGIPYVVHKIARGGMGFVLLLWKDTENKTHHQSLLGLKLALKVVLPGSTISEIQLYKRELTVWAGLNHLNIIRLLEIFDSTDAGWVAGMDWCPGSLRDILNERGKIPLKEATDILGNLIDGLSYAYDKDKILHLDLKPENILYHLDIKRMMNCCSSSKDELNKFRFMVSDWGIASIKDHRLNMIAGLPPTTDSAVKTLNNIGTVKYMAPERFALGVKSSISSDMFSLGMIYLEMLTGHLPFKEGARGEATLRSGEYIKVAKDLLKREKIHNKICDVIFQLISVNHNHRQNNYSILRSQLIHSYRKTKGLLGIFS